MMQKVEELKVRIALGVDGGRLSYTAFNQSSMLRQPDACLDVIHVENENFDHIKWKEMEFIASEVTALCKNKFARTSDWSFKVIGKESDAPVHETIAVNIIWK